MFDSMRVAVLINLRMPFNLLMDYNHAARVLSNLYKSTDKKVTLNCLYLQEWKEEF